MSIYSLFLSSFLLLSGCGLFNTAFSILIKQRTDSFFLVGISSSFYFIGILIGALKGRSLIKFIDLIKSFSILVSILSISTLCPLINDGITLLVLCRFIQGICISILFMIVEGWILYSSPAKSKGKILSFYMILLYSSFAFGQLFLIEEPNNFQIGILIISAILCMLSILPLSIFNITQPQIQNNVILSTNTPIDNSIVGITCCIISGMILSSIITIYPAYSLEICNKPTEVAFSMLIVFIFGTLIQYPIGYITDKYNKHNTLLLISILFFTITIVFFF